MILVITACGKSKENKPLPAGLLYKAGRIRYLYRKSKELNYLFYILSAEYGLINADATIEPYERRMNEERCRELKEKIKEILREIKPSLVVFYRGGSPDVYVKCVETICKELGIRFKTFGFANMGEISRIEQIIRET